MIFKVWDKEKKAYTHIIVDDNTDFVQWQQENQRYTLRGFS